MDLELEQMFIFADESIRKNGYAVIDINDKSGGVIMSFTLGFPLSYGFPDVIITGETSKSAANLAFRISIHQGIGLTPEELVGMMQIDDDNLKVADIDDISAQVNPIIGDYYSSRGLSPSSGVVWIARESAIYPFSHFVDGNESFIPVNAGLLSNKNH